MNHETGQLDISDRLTMASNVQPKASEWTEIGQAEVIHTIFGKAKVRIIHKHDKVRRMFSLLVSVAVVAGLWEGWDLLQRYVPVQNIYSIFQSGSNNNMSFSVSPPETKSAPDSAMMMKSQNNNSSENLNNAPEVFLKDKTAQPQININTGKMAAQPGSQRPFTNIKPQLAPLAVSNVATTNQANNMPLPMQAPKPIFQKPPLPIGVVQGSASSLTTNAPLETPVSKEDAAPASKEEAVPAPVGENQVVEPSGVKQ